MSLSKAGLVSPIQVTLQERDAIIDKQPGYIVYNTDEQEAEMWTGTEWIILGSRPGVLNYRGGIDMTTSAPTYQPPENGDMYLNEKEGVVTAGWENLTGLGVLPNDRVVFDGTDWALITSGGGIPNLQVVTDAGDTTTHAITTAGYITAGNVQATDGYFSGDVGIGTTSPEEKLHVVSDTNTVAVFENSGRTYQDIYLNGTDSNTSARLRSTTTNATLFLEADPDNTKGNSNIIFTVDGDEKARITRLGNVGIGTDSPGRNLVVDGGSGNIIAAFQGTGTGCGFGLKDGTTSADNTVTLRAIGNDLVSHAGGQERMRIDSAGNVGIGTDSPDAQLHVANSVAPVINLERTGAGFAPASLRCNNGGRDLRFRTNQDFYFDEVNDTRMTIQAGGNVGIGTDSPAEKLQVKGAILSSDKSAAYTDTGLYSEYLGSSVAAITAYRTGSNSCELSFYTKSGASAPAEAVRIDKDGKVGIGTDSPSEKLEVAGDICIDRGTENDGSLLFGPRANGNFIFGGGTSDVLAFATTGSERMRIDSTGRLLVGTDSAFSGGKLQVTGGSFNLGTYTNNAFSSVFTFIKSRSTSPGGFNAVQKDDELGNILFQGTDGSAAVSAASISSKVDGTPGANDMPGRLVFSTAAAGASSPTERMRITNRGSITIGSASTQYDSFFTIRGTHTSSTSNAYAIRQFADIPASVTNAVFGFHSASNVVSGASINNYNHFTAVQGTVTGSTITSQYGFVAGNNLTAATNNYGFYSNIASGSGRWNFYANGTAQNYFAGHTLLHTTNGDNILNGSVNAKGFFGSCVGRSSRDATTDLIHYEFYNPNGSVGSIRTSGSATSYNTSSDYRLKENIAPMTGAAERVKALKPCRFNFKAEADKTVDGFLAHEAQTVVPEAVTGTKDATEAIGTLLDWDGKVREENVTEPTELTYSEEVIDDPGQEGKEAVYSEPVLIQEYQPAVYGEPELISPATEPVIGPMGRVIEEGKEAVYGDPVLITPEVPEQWSEPELISPAVEEREPTYKTVTRQMSWTKTSDRDVMQGIDQSKLVPLLTAALQEALTRIEVLESKLA